MTSSTEDTGRTVSEGFARRQEQRVKKIMAERALDFAQAMNVYIEEKGAQKQEEISLIMGYHHNTLEEAAVIYADRQKNRERE